mmetsp:Transcript_8440/g.14500  ORF Transcript_8440/g.14500 Transcript_8440/m.14500 type:complete len:292 (+) Transcript_8440:1289-2164(+)
MSWRTIVSIVPSQIMPSTGDNLNMVTMSFGLTIFEATERSTPARVGMGIMCSSSFSPAIEPYTTDDWISPERRVLAPEEALRVDRTMTPAAGTAPTRAVAMFPRPCPMSSCDGSCCFALMILSTATPERRDSSEAKANTRPAEFMMKPIWLTSGRPGKWSGGRLVGMLVTSGTPSLPKNARAAETATAVSVAGIFLLSFGRNWLMPIVMAVISRHSGITLERLVVRCSRTDRTPGVGGAGRPVARVIWPKAIRPAIPAAKAEMIGVGMKRIRWPIPRIPVRVWSAPAMKVT